MYIPKANRLSVKNGRFITYISSLSPKSSLKWQKRNKTSLKSQRTEDYSKIKFNTIMET